MIHVGCAVLLYTRITKNNNSIALNTVIKNSTAMVLVAVMVEVETLQLHLWMNIVLPVDISLMLLLLCNKNDLLNSYIYC